MKTFTAFFFYLLLGINFTLPGASSPELEPCAIVVFGSTGDLTSRKLLPALYNLALEGKLSPNTAIVGFARADHSHTSFREQMGDAIDLFSRNKPRDFKLWKQFENKIFYNRSDFAQDQGYENLQRLLQNIDKELGTQGNRIYYLATAPQYFSTIVKKLTEHQLLCNSLGVDKKWSKVIIEKPFGHDLDSSIRLQKEIDQYLDEGQIYLMDHYLGKEGVQNILTFRFEDMYLKSLWNNKCIDSIQITLSEEIGIGTRANFWEETGTLRDVFQNHLLQILALIAMEPPASLDSVAIHEEKIKVLEAIRPFPINEIDSYVVRGQYGPGMIHGVKVPGYKQEKGVSDLSAAETFMAAKIFIDNNRWKGVPFYLRAGKRLPKQITEVVITFKNFSHNLYIRIQPNPTIIFAPFPLMSEGALDSYLEESFPEAYEKLIFDCIRADHSLYVHPEEQFAAWRLLTPVLKHWKSQSLGEIESYDAGTWGPVSADQMLRESGHQWQLLENKETENK